MGKLKIAIFHLAFVYSGGGERLVLEEAIGLSKQGFDVTCFVPIIDSKNCFPELLEKVKVKRLFPKFPSWLPDVELFSILASCILTPFLFFLYKNYDFYFGANQPGPLIAYLLSRINKIPYAIYLAQPTRLIHPRLIDQKTGLRITDGFTLLNLLTTIFRPLINFLDIKSIKGTNLVFANGSYAKGVLDEVYDIKTVNCPAGAYPKKRPGKAEIAARFKDSIILNSKKIKKPYILLTNRHFPQKKFEYAIEAVLMLGKKAPNLVITGKETAYTKNLKKQYKNIKNIHFVELVSERQLNRLYKDAAIYVYPSPEEDFGMGIVEAMAFGVPVVAWGNAGPTGIITDGEDGLLVKPFSIGDYANKIKKVLENRRFYERISKMAQKKVGKYFTYTTHNQILNNNLREYFVNWHKRKDHY